jgi:hypothetical protein
VFEASVTVTSTTQTTACGAPVIVKLFTALLLVTDLVKKGVTEPSGLALMSMRTPFDGIDEVTVTVSGKSGPGEAACTLPAAGDVWIVSVLPPLFPLDFLQVEKTETDSIVSKERYTDNDFIGKN